MLDGFEALRVQEQFGVALLQVKKDHAISHTLSVLPRLNGDVVFFGGTGLARTHLKFGRLSEDIDLYTTQRDSVVGQLKDLPNWIEQEFPSSNWEILPSLASDGSSSLLNCETGISISVQVLDSRSRRWEQIPTENFQIEQRYSDVPRTSLRVPTFDGFVAMKALAWFDRSAPRDLFDLGALSMVGPVTSTARSVIREVLGHELSVAMMKKSLPGDWQSQLAHQTKSFDNPVATLTRVICWWKNEEVN